MTKEPPPNLVYLLLRAYRWFESGVRARLAEVRDLPELTPSQLFLVALLSEGEASLSQLARRAGISRQGAQQAVRELTRMGLVELVADVADRRIRRVRMTVEGARIDAAAVSAINELEHELAAQIGEDAVKAMRRALECTWCGEAKRAD